MSRRGGAALGLGLGLALVTWAMAQDGAKDAGAPAAKAPKPTVTLSIGSIPSGAVVYHGRKNLGTTPLTVTRKRDSGPLDLVVPDRAADAGEPGQHALRLQGAPAARRRARGRR